MCVPLWTRTSSDMCEIVGARYSPFIISSVCSTMLTLPLHFEYIHSFHPNHCRHPIHHILCSFSSYNLVLVCTFFLSELSFFVEISSLVTPFKSAWPLSSVVVPFPELILVFINLDFFWIGLVRSAFGWIGFRLDRLPIAFVFRRIRIGWSFMTESTPFRAGFSLGWISFPCVHRPRPL